MKKITIFLLLSLCVSAASAQTLAHTLVIQSKNGERFYLKVDGFRRNKVASDSVEVKGIYASKARISVVFEDTLFASVRNYEVILIPEKGRGEISPMNSFIARYQIVAGKRKTKVKKIKITPGKSVPVYNPKPVSDDRR